MRETESRLRLGKVVIEVKDYELDREDIDPEKFERVLDNDFIGDPEASKVAKEKFKKSAIDGLKTAYLNSRSRVYLSDLVKAMYGLAREIDPNLLKLNIRIPDYVISLVANESDEMKRSASIFFTRELTDNLHDVYVRLGVNPDKHFK